MRTKRSGLRAGVLAVAAALLAACGSTEASGSNGNADDAGSPQSGGTATIAQITEPRSLDPALMGNAIPGNTLVGSSLYGQLLTVDGRGEIEYGLAEDLSTSDGGTTWELVLRDGLSFSDGTPFDAAAVQAQWERLRDPATGSQAVTVASYLDTMSSSGQTLTFTLRLPIAQFENVVAEGLNWIPSPRAIEAGPQAFDADPIGAGPFLLESWQRGGEMILTRNPDYYDSPRPYLDTLVLIVSAEDQQRLATVTSGGADAALTSNPEIVAQAVGQGLRSEAQQQSGAVTMAMNLRMAPFDDIRVRRAVVLGVDREAINAAAYAGEAEVPETLFAESSPYNGDATLGEYDPEAAQELFDEVAAEGRPVEFTITTYQTTGTRRVAEAVQAQLSQFQHVSVELEVLDFPAALRATAQRSFQMVPNSITFVTPMPNLYTLLHSSSAGNVVGSDAPALDAALAAGLSATTEDARTEALEEVSSLYSELFTSIDYIRAEFALLHNDRLQGVELYGSSSVRTDTMWVTE